MTVTVHGEWERMALASFCSKVLEHYWSEENEKIVDGLMNNVIVDQREPVYFQDANGYGKVKI